MRDFRNMLTDDGASKLPIAWDMSTGQRNGITYGLTVGHFGLVIDL